MDTKQSLIMPLVLSGKFCLLFATFLTLIQSSAPIQTWCLRTGTTIEGREGVGEDVGREGELSHYSLEATHPLCAHFILFSLFFFLLFLFKI